MQEARDRATLGPMSKPAASESEKNLAVNRQARHDYAIEETYEAGLMLLGTEVKSARGGKVQIKDAYARFRNGELWLVGLHIAPYTHASFDNHEPERPRKLLLRQLELKRLTGKVERAGYTLVPLRVYLKGPWIKVELALAKGRQRHEKKEVLRKKIHEREMRDAVRRRG